MSTSKNTFKVEILGTVKWSSSTPKHSKGELVKFLHLKMITLVIKAFLSHSYFTRRLRFIILIEKVREWKLLRIRKKENFVE